MMSLKRSANSGSGVGLIAALALAAGVLSAPVDARAQSCPSQTAADGCIQDRWEAAGHTNGGDLNCTAGDVSLSRIDSTVAQTCDPNGPPVTFTGTLTIHSNASGRNDIGVYIAEDGQPLTTSGPHKTLSGNCSVTTAPCQPDPFANLDTDQCGDVNNSGDGTFTLSGPITIDCQPCASDPTKVCVSACTSWKQTDHDTTCAGPLTAGDAGPIPGTSSKCDCEVVEVTGITIIQPTPTPTLVPTLPAPTNTPQPTATNTPQPTATNTPQPTATNTPQPTATNTPQPTATNTPQPTATNTPQPTATNTPQPTATNTPQPTPTATPTACANDHNSGSRAYGLSLVLGGSPVITPVPDTNTTNPDTLVDIPLDPLAHIDLLHVEAEHASTATDSSSTATADTANVKLLNIGTAATPNWLITADAIKAVSTCDASATQAGCNDTGTTLLNVVVAGEPIGDVSEPTIVHVNIPGLGSADVNLIEKIGTGANAGVVQPVSGVFSAGLTVNAIHVNITLAGTTLLDLKVGHAEASARFGTQSTCVLVPQVSGAGFVVGVVGVQLPPVPDSLLVFGEVARVDLPSTGGKDEATLLHVGPIANPSPPPAVTLIESNTAHSVTEGSTNAAADTASSHTKSEVEDLRVLDTGMSPTNPLIGAGLVRAECNSSANSDTSTTTGTTTLVGLSIGGTDICGALMLGPLCTPAANTDLIPGGPVLIRVNEQVCDSGAPPSCVGNTCTCTGAGASGMTVNAVHIFILGEGNPFGLPIGAQVIVSSASCDTEAAGKTIEPYSTAASLNRAPSTMLAWLFGTGAVGLLIPRRGKDQAKD